MLVTCRNLVTVFSCFERSFGHHWTTSWTIYVGESVKAKCHKNVSENIFFPQSIKSCCNFITVTVTVTVSIVHHRSCCGPRATGDYCPKVGAIASNLINKLYHCKHLLLLNENGGFCQLRMIKVFVL